ncbi:MAG: hypothetical protein AAGG38_15265, partial [Planctomycetota bacterium]
PLMTPSPNLLQRVRALATRLHHDERGAEGLEKLLIIAAVVLPLLGLLLFFRRDLEEFVNSRWEEVVDNEQDSGGSDDTTP